MDDNTAVDQTPVTDEVVEKVEPSRRELLEQAYDKASKEPDEQPDPEPEKVEAAKVEEADKEPASEPDVPTDIPGSVRQHWKDIPEPAREAILKSQREMSGKLSQVSRETTAFKPIRDMMTRAMKEIPGTSDLTPQQFAEQMWYLAQAGQRLNTDPEGALKGLAKQHKIDLAKLVGDAPQHPSQDQQTIRDLRQQVQTLNQHLQRVADPNYIRQQFDTYQAESTTATTVQEFAAQNEHWNAVEENLPAYVQAVKTIQPDAAPMQVLQRAYEMAVNDAGLSARAKADGAGEEPAPDAPQRVKTAVKAKSVNVKSGPGANSKPSDPKALMGQVYDRMMNS
jgi:hypothetical protein